MNRRSFFGFLAGALAAQVAPIGDPVTRDTAWHRWATEVMRRRNEVQIFGGGVTWVDTRYDERLGDAVRYVERVFTHV